MIDRTGTFERLTGIEADGRRETTEYLLLIDVVASDPDLDISTYTSSYVYGKYAAIITERTRSLDFDDMLDIHRWQQLFRPQPRVGQRCLRPS